MFSVQGSVDAAGFASSAWGRSGVGEDGEDVEYLLLVGVKIIPHPGLGQVKQQPLGIRQTQRGGGKA